MGVKILERIGGVHCEIVSERLVKLSDLTSEAFDDSNGSEDEGGDDQDLHGISSFSCWVSGRTSPPLLNNLMNRVPVNERKVNGNLALPERVSPSLRAGWPRSRLTLPQ